MAVAARIVAIFLLFGILPAQADDAGSPARLQLVAAVSGHGAEPFLAGIRMEMAPGWHTYWRVPGDSGFAPKFDWSASRNVASVDLRWPAPERFDAPGDSTFGYAKEVVWPVLVTPKDAKKPVKLALKFSYGICSNICVPGEAELTLAIPASTDAAPTPEAEIIDRFLARVPREPADPSLVSVRSDGSALRVRYRGAGEVPQLIVEGPKGIWFGKPQAARTGDAIEYVVPVEVPAGVLYSDTRVRLTLSGPETAIEALRSVE
ncbi:protein-disulfide reductase DsbD domain-containing protein [Parvibaculum sp.]|uniref:protein-disulfide reductase DsbD domain-containing protein n=1 Tax=Parvibaculum sp. TaxID=2024848 RepID=UPI00320DF7D3